MLRQYELVERVKAYDPNCNEDALNRAYVFSLKAHGTQMRASGDPYFSHPLEVAGILTEMRMDTATIITALLHDTVEDTIVTLADIEKMFGSDIARLVDGVTKLSRIEFQNEQTQQAENFRKLVLAMSEDIRVLLVKLADRLHNMRTLCYVKDPEKRRRKARETMDIYAPLAQRIGIQTMQEELEDLAFAEINPDARDSIKVRLDFLRSEGGDLTSRILRELQDLMAKNGLPEVAIYGREKTAYSIWRKMQRHNIAFEQLSDIMAFRIIVDSIEQCYQALGIIHSRYHVVPGRFKDYISTPKPNGYQSLHTGVIGPERQRIELQIRTRKMHDVSELGVAAHWDYKQGSQAGATDKYQYRWLRELLDIVEQAQRPEEFLEHTKLELFQDQVFCFSPKGDLIVLPRGATPVDFAYAVHSRIGDTCVGAKINGRMAPLRTALRNGDQVEITTARNQTPSPAWERFVVTGKARARIRKFIRQQQKTEYAALGKSIMQKAFQQENLDFSEKVLEPICKQFQSATLEDLYANVGASLQSPREVLAAAVPAIRSKVVEKLQQDRLTLASAGKIAASHLPRQNAAPAQAGGKGSATPLAIRGLIPGMAVHYARCCHPLPGDSIVGIVTTGKGVTIHTQDCETLSSFAAMPERWIDVAWDDNAAPSRETLARIKLVIANEPGSLGGLSTTIGKQGGNIANLKITGRSSDFYDMLIDIQVHDLNHLGNVLAALRAMPAVHSVERMRGR